MANWLIQTRFRWWCFRRSNLSSALPRPLLRGRRGGTLRSFTIHTCWETMRWEKRGGNIRKDFMGKYLQSGSGWSPLFVGGLHQPPGPGGGGHRRGQDHSAGKFSNYFCSLTKGSVFCQFRKFGKISTVPEKVQENWESFWNFKALSWYKVAYVEAIWGKENFDFWDLVTPGVTWNNILLLLLQNPSYVKKIILMMN